MGHFVPATRQSSPLDPRDPSPRSNEPSSYPYRLPPLQYLQQDPLHSRPPNCLPPHRSRPSSVSSVDSGYQSFARPVSMTMDPPDRRPISQSIPISSLITSDNPPAHPRHSPPTPPQPAERLQAAADDFYPAVPTRPRQACIPCRRKKVGCDLRREDSGGPPCLRCQHEKQECVVPPPESAFENPSPQELPSIRDLACPHCSLVFLRDHDLRAHLRTQCQEKHYVCPTCQARFRRLNDLDRHLRIHTGERPHACDICGRKFSRATTLTRHRQGPDGCAGRRADLGKRRFDRPPADYRPRQQQPLPTAQPGYVHQSPPT